MPLVRIDLIKGRTAQQKRGIADAIHSALTQVFKIPERDRFHIVTEHDQQEIIAEDAGLGFYRTAGVVIIQIFTQSGRSSSSKAALFKQIHDSLREQHVASEDVFISYVENGPEDWSFGFGRAQYQTGELAIPRAE